MRTQMAMLCHGPVKKTDLDSRLRIRTDLRRCSDVEGDPSIVLLAPLSGRHGCLAGREDFERPWVALLVAGWYVDAPPSVAHDAAWHRRRYT